jgi:hypothetical protein
MLSPTAPRIETHEIRCYVFTSFGLRRNSPLDDGVGSPLRSIGMERALVARRGRSVTRERWRAFIDGGLVGSGFERAMSRILRGEASEAA